MLPAQRNKVDLSSLNEQERMLFQKYGKMPNHKSILLKTQKERKYFDSGDYALSKAGVAPQTTVGTAIPSPENIPHSSPSPGQNNGISVSPTGSSNPVLKESGLASDKDLQEESDNNETTDNDNATSSAAAPSVTAISDEAPMRTD